MKNSVITFLSLMVLAFSLTFAVGADAANESDKDLAADLASLQGSSVLLHGDPYRNYLPKPKVWQWKRIAENDTVPSTQRDAE